MWPDSIELFVRGGKYLECFVLLDSVNFPAVQPVVKPLQSGGGRGRFRAPGGTEPVPPLKRDRQSRFLP